MGEAFKEFQKEVRGMVDYQISIHMTQKYIQLMILNH